MHNFTYFYDKLLNFYKVNSLKDLSKITNIPISTISSIKQRESITALKKKCRELDIYNDIFDTQNIQIGYDESNIPSVNYVDVDGRIIEHTNKHYTNEKILKMNKTIVDSFINVYEKLEKEGNLKKLYFALGKLEFEPEE